MDPSQPLLAQPPVILALVIVAAVAAIVGISFAFKGSVHL